MARIYDEMSAYELEELAEEQQKKKAALSMLAKSDPKALGAMTANERKDFLNQREAERRDDWHRANMEARDRRLDARDQIAMRDTGRYSRWDREAAKDWLSRNDRNNNLDEDRKNALEIQKEKTKGMVGQGSEAAKANAQAAIEASRNQWGYFDTDGKFIGGGEVVKNENENAAKERLEKMGIEGKAKALEAQNKNNLDVVTQQGKNATALEQERANTETAKLKTIEAQKAMAADRKMEELRLRGFQKMDIEKYKSMYKGMDEDREGGGMQNPMKKALTDEEMIKKWGGTPEGKLMLKERFGIDVDKATDISQYETT